MSDLFARSLKMKEQRELPNKDAQFGYDASGRLSGVRNGAFEQFRLLQSREHLGRNRRLKFDGGWLKLRT